MMIRRLDFSTILLCINADVMSTMPILKEKDKAIAKIMRGDTRATVGDE